jgi:hypothetical protein
VLNVTENLTVIEKSNIDWQEKLGCSILTRKEVYALSLRTDKYYVYMLWKMYLKKPIPFYVGKGHWGRILKHETPSDDQNTYKNRVINKHRKQGIEIGYSILSWHTHEEAAFEEETRIIALIGRHDLSQGILTNKTNGGNGTRGHIALKRGDSHSAKPVYAMNNSELVRYTCIADCAEALGIDSSLVWARIRNGWPGYYYEDEGQQPVIDGYRGFYRKPIHTPSGVFESLSEAGRQLKISHKQLHKRIIFGWKGYYYVDEGQRPRRQHEKAVEVAGVEFDSQKNAALAFEISTSSLKKRLESSNFPDWVDLSGTIKKQVKKQPIKAIWIGNKKYSSLMEAEKSTGINHTTLAFRAASSNYPDINIEGVIKEKRSEKMAKLAVSIIFDGKEYQTLSDASRKLKLDISTIKIRCRSLSFPTYNSTDPDLQKRPPKDGKPSLRKIVVNGVHYRSINAASKAVCVTRAKLKEMALDNKMSNVYFEI